MKTKKRIFKFFTIADYIEQETWLTKMHQDGWQLVKIMFPILFVFEKTNQTQAVYKLDFKNKSADADYIQLYQDYGWEYVTSCEGWNYFRKIDSQVSDEEAEIFSDNESKIQMIQRIYTHRLLPIFLLFFGNLPLMLNVRNNVTSSVAHYIVTVYFTVFILLLIFGVYALWKLVKLKRSLK